MSHIKVTHDTHVNRQRRSLRQLRYRFRHIQHWAMSHVARRLVTHSYDLCSVWHDAFLWGTRHTPRAVMRAVQPGSKRIVEMVSRRIAGPSISLPLCNHIYIHMYIYICIYINVYICIYIFLYVSWYVYIEGSTRIVEMVSRTIALFFYFAAALQLYLYTRVHIYVWMYIYTCIYVNLYEYVYYIYTYIHIYVQVYKYKIAEQQRDILIDTISTILVEPYIWTYQLTYKYTYIHVYIYIHTYICTRVYKYNCRAAAK